MLSKRSRWFVAIGAVAPAAWLAMASAASAQLEPPAASAPQAAAEPAAEPDSLDELSLAEEQIRAKYQRFEQVLLRMSELTAASDPRRAALLRKAVGQSKEKLIGLQLERLVEVLKQERLANAVAQQTELEQDLAGLLELLLTEQRSQKLKDERERVKEQIRLLNELINKQQQLQAQTAGNADAQRLADAQNKLKQQTGKLADEMQAAENDGKPQAADDEESQDQGPEKAPSEGKSPGGKKAEPGKNGEQSEGEQPAGKQDSADQDKKAKDGAEQSDDSKQGKKSDAEKKAQGKPGQDSEKGAQEKSQGEPAEGQPSDDSPDKAPSPGKQPGKPQPGGQGQPGESQDQDQEQPSQPAEQPQEPSTQESARRRVEAARERMEAARKKLEQAQREGALPEQEQAVRELELAKAKLEDILRQLREEELQRTLALLEARFRKMLEMQVEVYDATKLLAGQPAEDRDRNDEIEAGRLSRKESQIVIEVDAALAVLHEEGSAVAFPEAVGQMREDMEQVAARLSQAKADEITVGIEEEIVAALEEMIAALQKAQKDQEEKQQQQGQGQNQQGEPQEPPLVDALAELKMIRSLQMRVNNRTERYAKLVAGDDAGQADKAELIDALQKLSERETRIFKATRDIVLEKNK